MSAYFSRYLSDPSFLVFYSDSDFKYVKLKFSQLCQTLWIINALIDFCLDEFNFWYKMYLLFLHYSRKVSPSFKVLQPWPIAFFGKNLFGGKGASFSLIKASSRPRSVELWTGRNNHNHAWEVRRHVGSPTRCRRVIYRAYPRDLWPCQVVRDRTQPLVPPGGQRAGRPSLTSSCGITLTGIRREKSCKKLLLH